MRDLAAGEGQALLPMDGSDKHNPELSNSVPSCPLLISYAEPLVKGFCQKLLLLNLVRVILPLTSILCKSK
jgi:hypothetical protein